FPVMMFGLPGAALAMYHTAKDNRRKVAGSLLLAGALTSFLTGVTEPLEFAFMFLAPGLYLVHALLTGIAVFIAASFKWIAGFGFSAGLIDYLLSLNIPVATNIFMLIPLGLAFFAIYYFTFRFIITKFDLKTPGREDDIDENEGEDLSGGDVDFAQMAAQILKGLGGAENIDSLDHCITRLRVEVKDRLAVNEKEIKKTRVSGVIRPSKLGVQVIVGPQVQFVYEEVKKLVEKQG
ncbi:MAG: PTS glucose transporter subunit IIBC, partial [Clostridiales bacterium]